MRVLLCWLLAVIPLLGEAADYSHVYAFGDSYSDNGRSRQISRQLLAANVAGARLVADPPYWQGRWSNGPTAVEYLAESLAVPLTDYAVGGAKSGRGNAVSWMDGLEDTGAAGQVSRFLDGQAGPVDAEALYVLFVSANDFFARAPGDDARIDELAERAVDNQVQVIQRLLDRGARELLVIGSSDLALVPMVRVNGTEDLAARFTRQVNEGLARRLPPLAAHRSTARIILFDHVAFSNALRTSETSGLQDFARPCLEAGWFGRPCTHPDSFYFWDGVHPTTQVHRLLARAIARAVAR